MARLGALKAAVPAVIRNVPVTVAFPLVASTTVTVLAVSPALAAITQEALTVVAVGVPLSVQVTPAPLIVTPVASCRLAPVIVTG
jgi:hypothetical protein